MQRNCSSIFFFNDTATTEIYTLSLHDALPIRWRWRTPSVGDGPSTAPLGSQAAVSRTTRAASPARSWFSVSTERPSLTVASATVQPTGKARTHGTIDADGTDWACNHSGSRWVQSRLSTYSGVLA